VSITADGRESPRVGFGDDVAAGAGLVASDDRGEPVFCGDALADPLTGLVAAELALSAPEQGRGRLFDVSMTAVVASTLTGAPSFPARRVGTEWEVDAPDGPVPVAPPRHRAVTGQAAEPGEHTTEVLSELGIPSP
jgi:crotonobetainyl-CoA:carnitine CoA-transferase CaiB-like acyl-CoA transferase